MSETPNRLIEQRSPYLLQHAHNPVDWHPWGEEAFERARDEDRPIFLSIGYATCHWCHVMERESFEDEEVAELLNESFVSIKVDREERPDVDSVYMTVCQMLTGQGGWPLTVVMTPDKRPFFAGTYFPKQSRGGRIGMLDLLPRLRELWESRRDEVFGSADRIVESLRQATRAPAGPELDAGTLDEAFEELSRRYDRLQGGFGSAPKFPTPHNLLFLLRYWKRTGDEMALSMVETTLRTMRRGGVFDHVGYGFHRYSTDARWLLPHFEKMLYDQALLALAYTEAFQATRRDEHARVAREILTYVLRDMTDPGGGFYSAEDADSEGREGKFYLWTTEELEEVLGPEDAALARRVYDLERRGNFADEATGRRTGENILHLPKPPSRVAEELGEPAETLERRLSGIRDRLFRAREKRIRPLRDDKILVEWNGMMIAALARAGAAFPETRYLEAAARAAEFLLANLRDERGRLLRRYRDGDAAIAATAADYACLGWGLIELYEAGFDPRHLERAIELCDEMVRLFWDERSGGLFQADSDVAAELPVRMKETYDGATPSANSVAWYDLLRLSRLTGDPELSERADQLERASAAEVRRAPAAHAFWMVGLSLRLGPAREVVIVEGEDGAERMLEAVRAVYLPEAVTLLKPRREGAATDRLAPFTRNQRPVDGKTTAYVCRDYACERPTTRVAELEQALAAGGP